MHGRVSKSGPVLQGDREGRSGPSALVFSGEVAINTDRVDTMRLT